VEAALSALIGIGNEHPDSLLTYPDALNLSGYAQPIRMRVTYPRGVGIVAP